MGKRNRRTEKVIQMSQRINGLIDSIDPRDLIEMAKIEKSLRSSVSGHISEKWLRESISLIPGITDLYKPSDTGPEKDLDLVFTLNGRRHTIQCKSICTDEISESEKGIIYASVQLRSSHTAQRSFTGGEKIGSRYPVRGKWGVVAVHLYLLTGNLLDFAFIREEHLPSPGAKSILPEEERTFYIVPSVKLTWPDLPPNWVRTYTDLNFEDDQERSEQAQEVLPQESLRSEA